MEWVVTFRIAEKGTRSWGMAEFYRGSEKECRRIAANFSGGECDIVKTNPWEVVVGPVEAWQEFLLQFEDPNDP